MSSERERQVNYVLPSPLPKPTEQYVLAEGFSSRLNYLLDNIAAPVPPLERGRKIWIARTFDVTPPIASKWLLHDNIPKNESLRLISDFIYCLLPPNTRPKKSKDVECWLVYSSSARWVPNFPN